MKEQALATAIAFHKPGDVDKLFKPGLREHTAAKERSDGYVEDEWWK